MRSRHPIVITPPRRRRDAVVGSLGVVAVAVAAVLAVGSARAGSASPLTELVDAAAQRLQVAEPVAAFKWNTHGAVEDPARVQQQLAELGDAAAADHLDRDYVTRIFGDQIEATEAIEYRRFADWKLNPAAAPGASPDLSSSRATIDGFNRTMLSQIADHWDELHSAACAAQLDAATVDVTRAHRLDGLYQQALALATHAYCQR
ncbi:MULTISPECIES: chorismate mutase [unclassified Mycobacterium]|uniref:chorismate mutase n=1 Tax=unclassified Mycobacterium TaxID=2642494 RepID=UPI0009EE09EE|nr:MULTISPECIES: chorismate mutase [unclassified Mycobacterium]